MADYMKGLVYNIWPVVELSKFILLLLCFWIIWEDYFILLQEWFCIYINKNAEYILYMYVNIYKYMCVCMHVYIYITKCNTAHAHTLMI